MTSKIISSNKALTCSRLVRSWLDRYASWCLMMKTNTFSIERSCTRYWRSRLGHIVQFKISWWCGGYWRASPFLVVETCFETPRILHEFVYEEMIKSLLIPDATLGRFRGKARAWLESSSCTNDFDEVVSLTLSIAFLVGLILSCICRFVQRPRLPLGAVVDK